MSDLRLEQAKQWLTKQFSHFEIQKLAGDASFRRYFRVLTTDNTYVLMDAPPEKEDISPFIHICDWLAENQLRVPQIIIRNQSQGFLLLEDFGDITWSIYLKQNNDIAPIFEDALQQLHRLQTITNTLELPYFDITRMQRECDLYLDWYLPHIKGLTPSPKQRQSFHHALQPLLAEIHALPQAVVHLDYHSRNLMVPKDGLPLGIIDFQDAVIGPVTYDLASLLYDCYQDYPETERRYWSQYFFAKLNNKYKSSFQDSEAWHHAVRLTSLQRHIKVLGIFARLAHRDGKTQFLDEIPLTHQHCMQELQALSLQIPLLNT